MSLLLLTTEQVNGYHSRGYITLSADEHKLVDPATIKDWTNTVKNWPLVKGKWMPYFEINTEGERQIMRTENFVEYHEGFKELLCGDRVRGVLAQLSGEEMLLFKDKINYKSSKGNGFHAHLDAPAYDHMGKIEHVTANFAIDAATRENGCLEVVPGSHLMKDIEFVSGGRISDAWSARQEWVEVPLAPGDVLIFGSHLAHRSGPNRSDSDRAALYATFNAKRDGEDLRERYYQHRRKEFPCDHEREAGKNYTAGVRIYGFAAPFTAPATTGTSTSVA